MTVADAPYAADAGLLAPLTAREQEVLRLVMLGHGNADIAATLSVTRRTVEAHVTQLLQKLGVKSRAQAILRAQELGLTLQPPRGVPRLA
ncbi:MAG TPA: helix-turn-helix transcriptional regulator [Chloroflexota bacterium]|nr:helix-turn-helix transcriptional regulator [Chloroflexota bacterium]